MGHSGASGTETDQGGNGTMAKRTCTYEGCSDKHLARGWCVKHYQRWRKYGDPAIKNNRWGQDREAASKVCSKCRRELPIDCFYKRGDSSPGRVSKCKECWGPTPEQKRGRMLARYNLTPAQFDEMLAAQGGGCAICGDEVSGPRSGQRSLAVDHDHATGLVRGILCYCCNAGLGMFKDNPERLIAAIGYLEITTKPGQQPLFAA